MKDKTFWSIAENRKKFYASNCNSSGSRTSAWSRKFIY